MQRQVAGFWKQHGHVGRIADPQDVFVGRKVSDYLDSLRISHVIHLRGIDRDSQPGSDAIFEELVFDLIPFAVEVPRSKGRIGEAWKRQAAARIEQQCQEAAAYVADVLCHSLGALIKSGVLRLADVEQKIEAASGKAADFDFRA